MATRIHTTVSGHRIEYDPSPKVETFLRRLERMLEDRSASVREMTGLAYSNENPILDPDMFPGRGAVTRAVLDDPAYRVVTDLLFRKQLAEDGTDAAKVAAKYSMTVAEAAAELGVHESAIRQAIAAKRLASWIKDGRHYLDPRALRTFEVGTRGLRARERRGTPLDVCMGSAPGASFSVRADGEVEVKDQGRKGVHRGRVTNWKSAVVRTTGEGGSKRAFLLEPSDEENEVVFGAFFVRGRFAIAKKANAPRAAEELWKSFPAA